MRGYQYVVHLHQISRCCFGCLHNLLVVNCPTLQAQKLLDRCAEINGCYKFPRKPPLSGGLQAITCAVLLNSYFWCHYNINIYFLRLCFAPHKNKHSITAAITLQQHADSFYFMWVILLLTYVIYMIIILLPLFQHELFHYSFWGLFTSTSTWW